MGTLNAIGNGIGFWGGAGAAFIDVADIYVDGRRADDTGDGLTWATAKKTLSAAQTAATAGQTIAVSGGITGQTYGNVAALITLTKALTWKSAQGAGHNGLVRFDGTVTLNNNLVGTVFDGGTLHNFQMGIWPDEYGGGNTTATSTSILVECLTGTSVTFNDVDFAHNHTSRYIRCNNATLAFNRCRTYDNWNPNSLQPVGTILQGTSAASTVTANYCQFGIGGGLINNSIAGATWTFNNCSFISNTTDTSTSYHVNGFTGAAITTNFNNCIFIGGRPINTDASSVVAADRCFWSRGPSITNDNFADDMTGVTVTNRITQLSDLDFVDFHGPSMFGGYYIRVDDQDNIETSAAQMVATHHPAGLKGSFPVQCFGATNAPTQAMVEAMRDIVDGGSEIQAHGGSHSYFSGLNAFTCTGPAASTIVITVTETDPDDSDTWTGTLDCQVSSVSVGGAFPLNLMSASYNTIGEVIAAIDAIPGGLWNATISGGATGPNPLAPSRMLADQAGLAVSGAGGTVTFDEDRFCQIECAEAIQDLQAYIRTGADRNGNNISGAGAAAVGSASESYTITTFVSPGGNGSRALRTKLLGIPQITSGVSCLDTGNSDSLLYTSPQMGVPTLNNKLIAISATGTTPTVSVIVTNQGGLISTWAATLRVTINSVNADYDLTNASYDTIGKLITALNGANVGDGTVTCVKGNGSYPDSVKSVVLRELAATSISSAVQLQFRSGMFDIYHMRYFQIDTTDSERVYTTVARGGAGFEITNAFNHSGATWHNGTDDTAANLRDLCLQFDTSVKTHNELVQDIIDSADFDNSGPLYVFIGDLRDYMGYNWQPGTASSLAQAGAVLAIHPTTDVKNRTAPKSGETNPSVGAEESL